MLHIHRGLSVVIIVALLTSLWFASGAAPALAGGVVTDCSNDAQFSSLLAGGGTITFNCGTALINLSNAKTISADTVIDGGGQITLSGEGTHRLFGVNGGTALTLRNIVLTQGYHPDDGGAIGNTGALTLENTTIRDSRSDQSGGAIVSTGPLTITDSLLENNQALNGGALYPRFASARTTIISSTLRYNKATDTTNGWGGALLVWDGAAATIQDSDIYSNTARQGGGIYAFANSTLTLNGGVLRDNAATSSGGGLLNAGSATLTGVTFSGNETKHDGGGLSNFSGTVTLTNVTFSGNEVQLYAAGGSMGGGLYNLIGTVTLTNVTLSGNTADSGGGIYNNGAAVLGNVTLNGNTARGNGGGLSNFGPATLDSVTLSGNKAGFDGGGIANFSSLAVWNSTIDGNTSHNDGGGMRNYGTANLYNVTISHNVADYGDDGNGTGGGVYNSTGDTFNTRNTLLVVNYRALPVAARLNDCSGEIWSDHSRFTSVPVGCNIVGPSSFTTDPNGIGPLADNGGPTLTVALLPGSDAIDAADPVQGCVNFNSVLLTDQRGAPRVAGAWCDVGAYEFGSLLPRLFLPLVIR